MDRNEVILVGRLPEAAHIRSLQSGSTLGTWRLIVRRQHRGRGARVDTIPCASFETEVIEAVAGWLPDDIVEVTGSLRRRWWGSEGAKSSGYEVEARSVRRIERKVTTILTGDEGVPVPAPARSVRSLLHVGKGAGGQGAEPRLTPARPDLTSGGPASTPAGSGLAPAQLESAEAGQGPVPAGPDLAQAGPDLTQVGPDPAQGGPDGPALAPADLAPEGERVSVSQIAEVLTPGRPQVVSYPATPATRVGVASGVGG
ncbi:single-stranded DNA-binding protein [Streptosporangium sp. G11]|uniref:single-stranded DNA-binding protein n=1 Tax=Streptosporangium sp. G11 TaxID=3436926 RepID=UPI003EB77DEC